MKKYKVTLTIVETFFDDECNDATDATSHMYDEIAEMTYGEAYKHMKVEEIEVSE